MASSTTSNAEIAPNPHRPTGLRRHGGAFGVAAPRRWLPIDSSLRLERTPVARPTKGAVVLGRASQWRAIAARCRGAHE